MLEIRFGLTLRSISDNCHGLFKDGGRLSDRQNQTGVVSDP